jgi:ABC-type amino acid transport substrate-binding protein
VLKWIFCILQFTLLSYAAPKKVIIGLTVYPPFTMVDTFGGLPGIHHEYLSELLESAGFQPDFETLPWSRVLQKAENGKFDFLLFLSGAPETRENYVEIAEVQRVRIMLFGAQSQINLSKDQIIGKLKGTVCPLFAKNELKHVHFFDYNSSEQAGKMLAANHLNAICTTRELYEHEFRRDGSSSFVFFEYPGYRKDLKLSLFVHKDVAQGNVTTILNAYSKLKQKKTLSRLYKKYGIAEPTKL